MWDSHEPNTPSFYAPSQTALLLLDYHNHINKIQPAEQKEAILSSVQSLISAARKNSVPILHCLIDLHTDPSETSKLKQRWETSLKPMIQSTPEAAIEYEDFLPRKNPGKPGTREASVVKTPGCVSAMKSKYLLSLLQEKYDMKSLIICGLITSGAVLSTAREAADLGFVTTVVQDSCCDYSLDSHRVIMESVLPMTAWVTDLVQGVQLLQGGEQPVDHQP